MKEYLKPLAKRQLTDKCRGSIKEAITCNAIPDNEETVSLKEDFKLLAKWKLPDNCWKSRKEETICDTISDNGKTVSLKETAAEEETD